jgi:potassium efflux system protein
MVISPRNRAVRLCSFIFLLLAGWAAPQAALAQADASAAKKEEQTKAIEAVEQRIKELRTQYAAKPDEKLKAELLTEYQKRTTHYIKEAAEQESARRRMDREGARAPAELQRIEQELRTLAEAPPVALPADVKVSELDSLLEQRRKELDDARGQKDRLAAALKALEARRSKVDEELRIGQERLERSKTSAKTASQASASSDAGASPKPAAQDEPQDLVDARKASWDAWRLALTNSVAMLASEKQSYATTKEVLEQRLKLADAQIRRAEQVLKLTTEQVTQRRREAAEGQARSASADLERESHPLLKELAQENADLAHRRLEVIALAQQAAGDLEQRSTELRSLQEMKERTEKMVETVGLTSAVGMLLRNQRARLPSADFYRQSLRDRQERIRQTQYEQLLIEDERRDLERHWDGRLAAKQAAVVQTAGVADDDAAAVLRQHTAELLTAHRALVEPLAKDIARYFKHLVELDVEEQKLIDQSQQFAGYIDERILWVRSAERIELKDAAAASSAGQWLLGPAAWREVGRSLVAHLVEEPAAVVFLAVGVFLPWLAIQRRLRNRVAELGKIAAPRTAQQFRPTAEAVLHTLLLAAFVPALLWFFAWQLDSSPLGTQLTAAVAGGLRTVAQLLFPLACLRQMCRPQGLAEAHLNWAPGIVTLLAVRLGRLVWIGMPLVYVAAAMHSQDNEGWHAALGRSAFILLLIVFAKFLHGLLRPGGAIVRELAGGKADSLVFRSRHVTFALGVVGPLGNAGLAAMGYYYSAWQLAACCVATLYLGVGLIIVSGLVRRWVTLSHRRLAMEQRRKALREQMIAASDAGAAASAAGIVTELPPELDLAVVSDQTRRLLNVAILALAACGAWFIWGEVLPALNVLDHVTLWMTTDDTQSRAVTLSDLLLCVLTLAITGAAARNVPGLLQITVLQRLPIDSAMRYALDNVSRYLIVVAGVAIGLSTIGVGWARVQWLIAAVSVGLGFGLQEIFANFVSGLIVLFEQPIRVGDIVTIGDTTGVVSKIRIRATTITNWDRQELIVPNKDLITGKLLNWTLSDSVNRVVVNVGIAYGSDTHRASSLMLDIARRHPGVLREPPPRVTFEAFGDSTLNFALRAYLDHLDNRLDVVHDLHMAINDEFAKAGIEIAFPQRDIHIRSVVLPQQVAQTSDAQPPATGPQGVFGAMTSAVPPVKKAG